VKWEDLQIGECYITETDERVRKKIDKRTGVLGDPADPDVEERFDKHAYVYAVACSHATKKKSPAQLQREIDEVLAGTTKRSTYHATRRDPVFEPYLSAGEINHFLAAMRKAGKLNEDGTLPDYGRPLTELVERSGEMSIADAATMLRRELGSSHATKTRGRV
jgi:hypothetical protein